jgi:uncharacterized membrane protein (DUF4010 family)
VSIVLESAVRIGDGDVTDPALALAVSLGIGTLLGVERERRKGEGTHRAAAGVRTFALVGVAGGVSWRVGGVVTAAVTLAFVGGAAVAGYIRSGEEDPGLTTEVALIVDFLLGALAQREPAVAAGAGVATAIILAGREQIHRVVSKTLSERELHDGLLFAACALIVLPLLPDRSFGPHGSLNPSVIWRLVVIVMAMQAAGYVALRAIGPRYGLLVVGFFGGFVSSTATIGIMGARAEREPGLRRGATAAAVASSVATIVLLAIVVAAASVPVLKELTLPLILAGAAAVAYALLFAVRAARIDADQKFDRGRAFNLWVALLLAVTVTVVLLVSSVLTAALGRAGLVLGTATAGLADSQSAAISAATFSSSGHVTTSAAALAIMAALTANTLSKAVLAAILGDRRYAVQVWVGLVAILGSAWGGWVLSRLG